jgi:2-oxoisovalerate dehydrogenase E1 component
MVELCDQAIGALHPDGAVDLLDLRTLVPLDVDAILESVRRTGRCLIVHEDAEFAGFGAEIAALVADRAFYDLDAPVQRVAAPRVPVPFDSAQMPGVVPDAARIEAAMVGILRM